MWPQKQRSEWCEEGASSQGMQAASRSGKGKETDSSLEPPEGTLPADTLILVHWDFFWTFHLQSYKLINLCSLKPLNLWQSVRFIIGNEHNVPCGFKGDLFYTVCLVQYQDHPQQGTGNGAEVGKMSSLLPNPSARKTKLCENNQINNQQKECWHRQFRQKVTGWGIG